MGSLNVSLMSSKQMPRARIETSLTCKPVVSGKLTTFPMAGSQVGARLHHRAPAKPAPLADHTGRRLSSASDALSESWSTCCECTAKSADIIHLKIIPMGIEWAAIITDRQWRL
jgi:hypothetical protein